MLALAVSAWSLSWLPAANQETTPKETVLASIERLNDDDVDTRDGATASLLKLGQAAIDSLKHAAHYHSSAEVRGRAQDLVLRIYRRELPVREGVILLDGIHFFAGGKALLAVSTTGLAILVLPRGEAQVQVVERGVEIRSRDKGEEAKILVTVFDIQVTVKGKTLKGYSEEDLKTKHADAYGIYSRACTLLPLDFAHGQVINDPSKPPKQSREDFLKDLKDSYGSLLESVRKADVPADLKDSIVRESRSDLEIRLKKASE